MKIQAEGTVGTEGGAGDLGCLWSLGYVEGESLGGIFLLPTYLIYSLSASWRGEAWLLTLACPT